jgi:hypothetical protein
LTSSHERSPTGWITVLSAQGRAGGARRVSQPRKIELVTLYKNE